MDKKNRIIMFQPSVGDMDIMRTKPFVPLGILHSVCKLRNDFDIKIIDQRIFNNWRDFVEESITQDTVCVGITSYTGNMIKDALEFSGFIKDKYNLPVVWGGIHSTILPHQTLKNRNIDFVIEGEGEETFSELVSALLKGLQYSSIKGLWYKDKGNSVPPKAKRDFLNMDELPEIPYDLVNLEDYLPVYMKKRTISYQSSRGCPNKCHYCYNSVVHKGKWRAKSAQKTIDEISRLVLNNNLIEAVYFVDDEFFVDMERAKSIAMGLKKLGIYWSVQGADMTRLKKMDDSFFRFLESCNCLKLSIGVETGSGRMRQLINKKGTNDDILEITRRLSDYNMILYCNFMIGIPTESTSDIMETILLVSMIRKLNRNSRISMFYICTPYPGTKLYGMLQQQKVPLPNELQEWANYSWNSIKHKGVDKKYEDIVMLSLFIDKKADDYDIPLFFRLLTAIYRPVALFRIKKLFFSMMFERPLFNFTRKIWYAVKRQRI